MTGPLLRVFDESQGDVIGGARWTRLGRVTAQRTRWRVRSSRSTLATPRRSHCCAKRSVTNLKETAIHGSTNALESTEIRHRIDKLVEAIRAVDPESSRSTFTIYWEQGTTPSPVWWVTRRSARSVSGRLPEGCSLMFGTARTPNRFPTLPVRDGGPVVVRLGGFPNAPDTETVAADGGRLVPDCPRQTGALQATQVAPTTHPALSRPTPMCESISLFAVEAISCSRREVMHQDPLVSPVLVRDGRHDFDFLIGSWRVDNQKRKDPLDEASPWVEFVSGSRTRPILGGLGIVERYLAPSFPGRGAYEGMALALYESGRRCLAHMVGVDIPARIPRCSGGRPLYRGARSLRVRGRHRRSTHHRPARLDEPGGCVRTLGPSLLIR